MAYPAFHISVLSEEVISAGSKACECELGIDCIPFSKLKPNFDFCQQSTFPPAVCFEKLGIVVHRPSSKSRPRLEFADVTFVEAAFATFRLPEIGISPWTPPHDGGPELEWPLGLIGTALGSRTGKGVRVCLVDSGVDDHPDIPGLDDDHVRSFRRDPPFGDALGHGTFNAGIICGAAKPRVGARFGVAPDVELFVAKVFNEARTACTVSLLAAIEWALQNRCDIVSMSIGKQVNHATGVNACMSVAAGRALEQGLLIIAGTGNDSNRNAVPPRIAPVAFPANCTGVMAVGAVKRSLELTSTSNVSVPSAPALVDLVAPGADVRSTGLDSTYALASGTSIATPHVAGVAALFAEACGIRGQPLWDLVVSKVTQLPGRPSSDFGAGLVRAPMDGDECLCMPRQPCLQKNKNLTAKDPWADNRIDGNPG